MELSIDGTHTQFGKPDFSGLIGAIAWNLLTWWFGIPSSSSHTLIGGFMGAAIAHAGALSKSGHSVINYAKVIPTFLFIFLAPIIGMIIGTRSRHVLI